MRRERGSRLVLAKTEQPVDGGGGGGLESELTAKDYRGSCLNDENVLKLDCGLRLHKSINILKNH